ncbi:MAG: DUF6152 family protein [Pseudomonadota bacterium]
MNRILTLLALSFALIQAQASHAHHSFAAEFTADDPMTIEGVITEIWFRNPHARYYVDVMLEDGNVEHWDTRAGSPSLMTRRGWTRNSINEGDRVVLFGHRAHDPARKLLSIIWVELADGTRLE